MKKFIAALACCVLGAGFGGDITPEQQTRFYDQCLTSCVPSMGRSKLGEALKDKPFFVGAYCSCYCARIALRVTTTQIAQMAKDAVNTGNMSASGETRQLGVQAGQLCIAPFTEP